MEIFVTHDSPLTLSADALVIGICQNAPLSGAAETVNQAIGGSIQKLIDGKEFSGKPLEVVSILAPAGVTARQVVLLGLGEASKFNVTVAYRAAAAAARALAAKARPTVAFVLEACSTAPLVEAAICGAMVGCQGQDQYRAERNRHPFQTILWNGEEAGVASGSILGNAVNLTRSLVNAPPCEIFPASFADRAAGIARENGMLCEIWDYPRLEQERCGSLLAVAMGSIKEPRLVILSYQGAGNGAPTLGLVGKGVTFDSGGLSLKTSEQMIDMKCDMAGAATVLGAMQAIAQLKLPVNVLGFCGLVENMTGPAAMKLGDVLTARSGRTIEVLNTDAEGRLVLADVLDVAAELGCTKLVDLATLTGACMVALGTEVAGLMSNDQTWCDQVATTARACGEPAWQLPMDPEIYDDLIKSEVADIKNVGDGRYGGAITAAKFLEQFVKGKPWTHIDIAGPAFRAKAKPWAEAGASGQFVRTLVELARNWNS